MLQCLHLIAGALRCPSARSANNNALKSKRTQIETIDFHSSDLMGSKRLALFMTLGLTFDLPAAEAQRPVVETRSSVLFINVRTSTGKKSVCMALTSDRIGSDRYNQRSVHCQFSKVLYKRNLGAVGHITGIKRLHLHIFLVFSSERLLQSVHLRQSNCKRLITSFYASQCSLTCC